MKNIVYKSNFDSFSFVDSLLRIMYILLNENSNNKKLIHNFDVYRMILRG